MKPIFNIFRILIIGAIIAVFAKDFKGINLSFLNTPIFKPECNIKGNISVSTGRKLYHLQGMKDYERTIISPEKGERWFCTESEAIKNGWSKAPM